MISDYFYLGVALEVNLSDHIVNNCYLSEAIISWVGLNKNTAYCQVIEQEIKLRNT